MNRIMLPFLLLSLMLAEIPRAYPFAVSLPTQWCTEAAIEILNKGGNATDAMVASAFVLNVTQPYNMGIGGGGFYLMENKGKVQYWDSRETAPASARPDMFLGKDGKPLDYYPERVSGPNPVGVPGTLAGLATAHKKYGKLAWKTVLAPAIRIAREGFPLTLKFAENLKKEWPRISKYPTTAAIFGDGHGGPKRIGHILRQPQLAETLTLIANKGSDSFYKGELARSWISEASKFGVTITLEDLAQYKVREEIPVESQVFGFRAVTAPPPSAAGLMVMGTLRFLEHYYREHNVTAPDSAIRLIVTTEALRFFQNLRNANINDRGLSSLDEHLIDPRKFLKSPAERQAWTEIEKEIKTKREQIETAITLRETAPRSVLTHADATALAHSHTAHSSIIDDHGMAVAYTSTIEQWFGSGITVPRFGFLLNNELSDFTADPGKPNSPAPGKRPRSNMSPTLLFENQIPVGVIGCAGGQLIPTVIVEVLENYFIHKMGLREAMAFPRFHFTDGKLEVDPAFADKLDVDLKTAGYTVERTQVAGVPHMLLRRSAKDPWEAAAEPRADGLALVLPPRSR